MTNIEKIQSMSIDELAKYIFKLGNGREYCYGHCAFQDESCCPNDGDIGCISGIKKWLESETTMDDTE